MKLWNKCDKLSDKNGNESMEFSLRNFRHMSLVQCIQNRNYIVQRLFLNLSPLSFVFNYPHTHIYLYPYKFRIYNKVMPETFGKLYQSIYTKKYIHTSLDMIIDSLVDRSVSNVCIDM